jgi:hypothetical protein
MMTRRQANAGLVSAAIVARASGAGADRARSKELPPPRATGGKPLIDALKLRRSIREYADRPLQPQVLSDLLWAGFGVNRPAETAPRPIGDTSWSSTSMRRSLMAYGFTIRSSTGWNSACCGRAARCCGVPCAAPGEGANTAIGPSTADTARQRISCLGEQRLWTSIVIPLSLPDVCWLSQNKSDRWAVSPEVSVNFHRQQISKPSAFSFGPNRHITVGSFTNLSKSSRPLSTARRWLDTTIPECTFPRWRLQRSQQCGELAHP